MSEPITREEYKQTTERLFNRVDEIRDSVSRQEVMVKLMKENTDKMNSLFYGNGRDGLITKVSSIYNRVGTHDKILVGTFVCTLITVCVIAVVNFVIKK